MIDKSSYPSRPTCSTCACYYGRDGASVCRWRPPVVVVVPVRMPAPSKLTFADQRNVQSAMTLMPQSVFPATVPDGWYNQWMALPGHWVEEIDSDSPETPQ